MSKSSGAARSFPEGGEAQVGRLGLSLSTRLVGGRQLDSRRFELVLMVRDGEIERASSVRVSRLRGRFACVFPHWESECGESLGSAEADEVLRERAEQIVVLLQLTQGWRRFAQ